MTIWIALAGGIILGWVIEWIVDWLYWRRGIAGFYATESDLRSQLQNVQQQHTETTEAMSALRGQFDQITTSKATVDQQLQETVAARAATEQQLQAASAAKVATDQQLQETINAKAATEQQLQETLSAKAAADQQLQETISAKVAAEQQLQETATAKATVEQQLEEALNALTEARKPRRDDLEQIDGIGRVYEQKLFDAGINTFAQLAVTPITRLKEIITPAAWQHVDFQSWIDQARSSAEVVIFDLLPYRLEEIRGIGPTYAKRLNAEGIMTFQDLANTSETRLREIIPQNRGLSVDYASWIKQAHAFVGLTTGDRPPLPLERIKGIGPVFATRLDLAGIHTYADLANANEEQLRDLIGTRGIKVANLGRWIAEAKEEVVGASTQANAENGSAATPTQGG
jgi:predicted flap endonuclease-1-like 5' DNA nuclease